ncbi:MAG: hypothetical protein V4472_25145 [Pseudomonadota bacterium]|mgnify:CR=1 FL=1
MLVVPYVEGILAPETVAAVGDGARFVLIDPADDGAYSALLTDLWAKGADWSLLEQDVVPPYGWRAEFAACPWPWCVLEPKLRPGVAWLGCVRFRSELMAEHPDAMAEAQAICDDGDVAWTWRKADVRFARVMDYRHVAAHFHGPRCEHLHDPPAPPCGWATAVASPVTVYGPRTVEKVCAARQGHSGQHTDEYGQPIGV